SRPLQHPDARGGQEVLHRPSDPGGRGDDLGSRAGHPRAARLAGLDDGSPRPDRDPVLSNDLDLALSLVQGPRPSPAAARLDPARDRARLRGRRVLPGRHASRDRARLRGLRADRQDRFGRARSAAAPRLTYRDSGSGVRGFPSAGSAQSVATGSPPAAGETWVRVRQHGDGRVPLTETSASGRAAIGKTRPVSDRPSKTTSRPRAKRRPFRSESKRASMSASEGRENVTASPGERASPPAVTLRAARSENSHPFSSFHGSS